MQNDNYVTILSKESGMLYGVCPLFAHIIGLRNDTFDACSSIVISL